MPGVTEAATTITTDVVADLIAQVAGDAIDVGPRRAGPGGVATATAHGRVGRAAVREVGREPLAFEARVPVDIDLLVEATGGRHRYAVTAMVRIAVTVDVADEVATSVIRPLVPGDIETTVKAKGIQARLLQKVGDVEGELRREVAGYVNGRLDGPDVQAMARIPLTG